MKIFLSWSGKKSLKIAEALKDWLEQVIQSTEPWMSTNIEKGRKWSSEISTKLEESKVGIICLTRENLEAPWILFEAGAISNSSDSYVCTLLTDITSPTDVSGPLASFQATRFTKQDVLKLCKTINTRVKESKGGKSLNEKALEEVFETYWPKLEEHLNQILLSDTTEDEKEIRSDRDLLEESLEHLRYLKQVLGDVWTNKDVREIVEHYVKIYTDRKEIGDFDIVDEPHLSDFIQAMSRNPVVRKLFPLGTDLRDYLVEMYEPPF